MSCACHEEVPLCKFALEYPWHAYLLLLVLCCMRVFLQVLHTLNVAEGYRAGEPRNILQVRTAAVLAGLSKAAAGDLPEQ